MWLNTSSSSDRAYFIDAERNNTLTIPATARSVISVGGYDFISGRISTFSSLGGNMDTHNLNPSVVAPAENIVSCAPMGGYDTKTGTSMAAPFVTGTCALLMQWGIVHGNNPYLYGQTLLGAICSGAKRERNITYPNNSWGYGKLCALSSLDILVQSSRDIYSAEASESIWREERDKIMSEEFVDLIVEYNPALVRAINSTDDIIFLYLIEYNKALISMNRFLIQEFANQITILTDLSHPLLYGVLEKDILAETDILPLINNPQLNLTGSGTLVGIIDSGINYTHESFRYEDGSSKIMLLWDQTSKVGMPPVSINKGTEFTQAQINAALLTDNPFEIVPSNDTIGHGTFISSIAAGRNISNYVGIAPDAELIVVKLAPAKKNDREECMVFDEDKIAFYYTDIALGLFYLINKASEFDMPLSAILGLGTNMGPHDTITTFTGSNNVRSFIITAASGNEGNSRKHAKVQIRASEDIAICEFNVAEGESGIFVNIWGYAPDRFSISFESPSGERVDYTRPRNLLNMRFEMIFYHTQVWLDYMTSVEHNGDEFACLRFKNPEPGIWKIFLRGDKIVNGTFHFWMSANNWSKPDTFFIDSSPETTVTNGGSDRDLISVGAYNHVNQNLYIDGSRGPSRAGIIRPDLIAPGVNVSGADAGGGFRTASGTSISATIVGGAAALLLQWGVVDGNYPYMNTNIVKSMLLAGAYRRPDIVYPNNQYGYGQLDLFETFMQLSATFNRRNNYMAYLSFPQDVVAVSVHKKNFLLPIFIILLILEKRKTGYYIP
ncbi:MAG: S8 family serine peptidase [Clostridiales bacterium]|nr:S8 family serine peptidase [Clostridiales bacterium]